MVGEFSCERFRMIRCEQDDVFRREMVKRCARRIHLALKRIVDIRHRYAGGEQWLDDGLPLRPMP